MKYTDKDLERARDFDDAIGYALSSGSIEKLAQLIATVRRETIEECATVVERFDEQATNELFRASRKHMARRIRALLDEASKVVQEARELAVEPKCKVCDGPEAGHVRHLLRTNITFHDFEPEEPGHG